MNLCATKYFVYLCFYWRCFRLPLPILKHFLHITVALASECKSNSHRILIIYAPVSLEKSLSLSLTLIWNLVCGPLRLNPADFSSDAHSPVKSHWMASTHCSPTLGLYSKVEKMKSARKHLKNVRYYNSVSILLTTSFHCGPFLWPSDQNTAVKCLKIYFLPFCFCFLSFWSGVMFQHFRLKFSTVWLKQK